jgi:outer membrane protein assembly factor BamB
MNTRLRSAALAAMLASAAVAPASGADWPVFGHDAARSGVDDSRSSLGPGSVARLHLRWQTSLGVVADSTPILLERVIVRGTPRAMLYQTGTNGVTYALDAATGRIVWRFVAPATAQQAAGPSLTGFLRTAVFGPNVTNSTPAADPSGRAVYVPGLDGFVRKLDAASGSELRPPGFPVRITLLPRTEKNASALNVANGYLYVTTSGFNGDGPPYDGHVIGVRLRDGATTVFDSLCSRNRRLPVAESCSQSGSGIWSRGGAVVDPDPAMRGRLYVATGNGDFDANAGGADFGDSVLAFDQGVSRLLGSYTPADYRSLDQSDTDLGSTSPALLPRQPSSKTPLMLVQGGKDQVLKLLNRNPLPGVGGELQRLALPGRLFSTPAVWTDRAKHTWIFLGFSHEVDAYRLATGAHGSSRLVLDWHEPAGQTGDEGTSPVVSAGVVFVAFDNALVALDARSGRTLWSSAQSGAGRTIGRVHWQSPIVANGWVYCSDQDGTVSAYALP